MMMCQHESEGSSVLSSTDSGWPAVFMNTK
jgi:hypothetical protein